MSGPAIAAIYGIATFGALALAMMGLLHVALGWPLFPTDNRTQGMVLVAWYAAAGIFARNVGQHGAQGATLGQAWRAGAVDVARGFVGAFKR